MSGSPVTFSTMRPAMTKLVLEYCHWVPGSKSSGFLAQVSRICCARLGVQHGGHHVVLGPVVLVAGGVGEDLADGDFVAAGEAGDVLADRVVDSRACPLPGEAGWRRR